MNLKTNTTSSSDDSENLVNVGAQTTKSTAQDTNAGESSQAERTQTNQQQRGNGTVNRGVYRKRCNDKNCTKLKLYLDLEEYWSGGNRTLAPHPQVSAGASIKAIADGCSDSAPPIVQKPPPCCCFSFFCSGIL